MSMILNSYRYAVADRDFGNASREFDGDDSITTSYAGITNTNPCSVSFWFKTTSTIGGSPVAFYWGSTSAGASFLIAIEKGVLYGRFAGGNTANWGSGLNDNTWHHAVIVKPSSATTSDLIAYIDGELASNTSNGSDTLSTGTVNDVTIGMRTNDNYFVGNLADMRIYDYELTSGQAAALQSRTHITTGLVGWWITDSDDVLDYSGNGNDGTNNGSTYSTDGPFD
jgi:hypothetical protein